MSDSFQRPEEYIEAFPDQYSRRPNGVSAYMKAAADPDSCILRAVLACQNQTELAKDGDDSTSKTFGPNRTVQTPGQQPINTSLLQAIQSQLLQNVDILLQSGADPNGIDIKSLETYQRFFLRFRPSIPEYVDIDGDVADGKTLVRCMKLSQTAAILQKR